MIAASLTALAGWFGVGGSFGDVLHVAYLDAGPRRPRARLHRGRSPCGASPTAMRDRSTGFSDVFDHFMANLAFWGSIAWCLEWPWLAAGLPLLAALA